MGFLTDLGHTPMLSVSLFLPPAAAYLTAGGGWVDVEGQLKSSQQHLQAQHGPRGCVTLLRGRSRLLKRAKPLSVRTVIRGNLQDYTTSQRILEISVEDWRQGTTTMRIQERESLKIEGALSQLLLIPQSSAHSQSLPHSALSPQPSSPFHSLSGASFKATTPATSPVWQHLPFLWLQTLCFCHVLVRVHLRSEARACAQASCVGVDPGSAGERQGK